MIDLLHDLLSLHLPPVSILSFAALGAAYHFLAPRYPTAKQVSWIITTISSFFMIIACAPFVYDYIAHGGSVKHIRTLPQLAVGASRFFQAYLAADLALGVVYYRDQLSPLTGWFHHMFYILVVEMAVRRSWSHIFCLCAVMEIPTFILGIMALYPHLRSNLLFALVFFATRIALHVVLAVSYLLSDNRAYATGGSYVPAGILVSIFPLHAMWFWGCIQGFKKRAAKKREAENAIGEPTVIALDVYSVDTSATSSVEDLRLISHSEINKGGEDRDTLSMSSSSIQELAAMHLAQARRLPMRVPERHLDNTRGVAMNDSGCPLPTIEEAQLSVRRGSRRERMFEFVGLGRGSKQSQ